MPIYEYTCSRCSHRFEALQRLGAGAEGLVCPRCGHDEVAKVYSTFAGRTGGSTASAAAEGCGAPSCCRVTSPTS